MRKAIIGLALAAPAFAWCFRASRPNFWLRMLGTAGGLGSYALAVQPDLRKQPTVPADVAAGVASAAALYGIFQVGDRVARRVMPTGSQDILDIYALRRLLPRWLIALLLGVVIAPGEELFWRGLVQRSLQDRFGRTFGSLLAMACYGGVHIASGNVTLTGAATVAGAFWGADYAFRGRLPALIVSHIAWDIWIFLIGPTPGEAG